MLACVSHSKHKHLGRRVRTALVSAEVPTGADYQQVAWTSLRVGPTTWSDGATHVLSDENDVRRPLHWYFDRRDEEMGESTMMTWMAEW